MAKPPTFGAVEVRIKTALHTVAGRLIGGARKTRRGDRWTDDFTCRSFSFIYPSSFFVWPSLVILYVLLAGFLPFDETSMVELFRKIVKVSSHNSTRRVTDTQLSLSWLHTRCEPFGSSNKCPIAFSAPSVCLSSFD